MTIKTLLNKVSGELKTLEGPTKELLGKALKGVESEAKQLVKTAIQGVKNETSEVVHHPWEALKDLSGWVGIGAITKLSAYAFEGVKNAGYALYEEGRDIAHLNIVKDLLWICPPLQLLFNGPEMSKSQFGILLDVGLLFLDPALLGSVEATAIGAGVSTEVVEAANIQRTLNLTGGVGGALNMVGSQMGIELDAVQINQLIKSAKYAQRFVKAGGVVDSVTTSGKRPREDVGYAVSVKRPNTLPSLFYSTSTYNGMMATGSQLLDYTGLTDVPFTNVKRL